MRDKNAEAPCWPSRLHMQSWHRVVVGTVVIQTHLRLVIKAILPLCFPSVPAVHCWTWSHMIVKIKWNSDCSGLWALQSCIQMLLVTNRLASSNCSLIALSILLCFLAVNGNFPHCQCIWRIWGTALYCKQEIWNMHWMHMQMLAAGWLVMSRRWSERRHRIGEKKINWPLIYLGDRNVWKEID